MEALLDAQGISKAFPGVKALDNVDFVLSSGEIHALMGENGAGKSTLIKILTGVYPKDSGKVMFQGQQLEPDSPRAAEAAGISTVYQEINLVPHLSVAENIMLGRQPRRFGMIDWKRLREQARRALGRLELDLDVGQSVAEFPAAVQQLVAIARALAVDARLLILDEPTSSLDDEEAERLFGVMRRLRSEGLGILFVTHFLDQVYAVSDRITVLRNGCLVGQYAANELPRLKLVEAMLGTSAEALEGARAPAAPSESERVSALSMRRLKRDGVVGPIDLELFEGQVVGFAGLLGSGRSETARMLFGIDPATSGGLSVKRQAVHLNTPRKAIQAGLAYCAEDRKLDGIIPNLSVRENLILALQASRGATRLLSLAEQQKLAEQYIGALKIKTPSPDTPIKLLSGGNQQKVLLARWMAMQPEVIILDEPTRGIDVGAKLEIEKLIASLSEKGVATILISSELEELTRNCHDILVLRDRRQVSMLSGAEVSPSEVMHAIAQHEGGAHGSTASGAAPTEPEEGEGS